MGDIVLAKWGSRYYYYADVIDAREDGDHLVYFHDDSVIKVAEVVEMCPTSSTHGQPSFSHQQTHQVNNPGQSGRDCPTREAAIGRTFLDEGRTWIGDIVDDEDGEQKNTSECKSEAGEIINFDCGYVIRCLRRGVSGL